MKKIALILCLVLVASFVLSGCNNSDSIITLEDREVGKIEIQSGNTGETVEVTEEELFTKNQFHQAMKHAKVNNLSTITYEQVLSIFNSYLLFNGRK